MNRGPDLSRSIESQNYIKAAVYEGGPPFFANQQQLPLKLERAPFILTCKQAFNSSAVLTSNYLV